MKNKVSIAMIPIFMAMVLSSCATIMHGTTQTIGISSYPSDAGVWVDDDFKGTTPVKVCLKRKSNHLVRIELEGYQPYEMILTKQVSAWVAGNLVFGGLPGLVIDALSGGIYRLTPEQVQAEMRENRLACAKYEDAYLAVTLEPKEGWEKIGQLVKN